MEKIIKNIRLVIPLLISIFGLLGILYFVFGFRDIYFSKGFLIDIISSIISIVAALVSSYVFINNYKKKLKGNFMVLYSHKNADFVRSLKYQLSLKGIEIKIDNDVVNIGDDIQQKVQNAISNSDAIIVILDNSTSTEKWINLELEFALSQTKKILPIILDPNTELPEKIKNIKYADFSKETNRFKDINDLEKSLKIIITEPERK